MQSQECIVCCELVDETLPCGHWVHKDCVQKAADALQEIRAAEGYPPIVECYCPLCKQPVPDMKPVQLDSTTINGLDVVLEDAELFSAFREWERKGGDIPISWYLWLKLLEKYPDYGNPQRLVAVADLYQYLIKYGIIDPRPPTQDYRFQDALEQDW